MPTPHAAVSDRSDTRRHQDLYSHPAITQMLFNTEHVYDTLLGCIQCIFVPQDLQEPKEVLFYKLVAQWREETGGLSSPRSITNHSAYKRIIEMGPPVVELIFKELRENGGWWYPALRTLTGANPVPDSARGRPSLNDNAWLEWGEANGYA